MLQDYQQHVYLDIISYLLTVMLAQIELLHVLHILSLLDALLDMVWYQELVLFVLLDQLLVQPLMSQQVVFQDLFYLMDFVYLVPEILLHVQLLSTPQPVQLVIS